MGLTIILLAAVLGLFAGMMATTHPIAGIITGVVAIVMILSGVFLTLKGVD